LRPCVNSRPDQKNRNGAHQRRNLTFARNLALNRGGNVRIVNDWRNDRFRGGDYVAFYNYNRTWYDHSWWVSAYPRVVFVLGGWRYWNTGYADVTPDRIIEDVQLALRQQGYYA
jgi:hypothetical protein